jgi:hypothetical protein
LSAYAAHASRKRCQKDGERQVGTNKEAGKKGSGGSKKVRRKEPKET